MTSALHCTNKARNKGARFFKQVHNEKQRSACTLEVHVGQQGPQSMLTFLEPGCAYDGPRSIFSICVDSACSKINVVSLQRSHIQHSTRRQRRCSGPFPAGTCKRSRKNERYINVLSSAGKRLPINVEYLPLRPTLNADQQRAGYQATDGDQK